MYRKEKRREEKRREKINEDNHLRTENLSSLTNVKH